jgi:aryl-alcohol dehydrogenase-like predicted oxidoreductase
MIGNCLEQCQQIHRVWLAECCLGTMTWGRQNTEAEAHEQLNYAFEEGLNFLDGAEMYPVPSEAETQGRTERYIGSWLKGRSRDGVVVATKVLSPSCPRCPRCPSFAARGAPVHGLWRIAL